MGYPTDLDLSPSLEKRDDVSVRMSRGTSMDFKNLLLGGAIFCLVLSSRVTHGQYFNSDGIPAEFTISENISSLAPCTDLDDSCDDPCPLLPGCESHDDCGEGYFCTLGCDIPTSCICFEGQWYCGGLRTGRCVQVPTVLPPPNYHIVDLGTLGGWTANAAAINNYAQVVGEADTADGTRHAFLWENGIMTDIGASLPPPWSAGKDINHNGQVMIINGETRTWLWDGGVVTRVQHLTSPEGSVYGHGMNDYGEVVGRIQTAKGDHGFHWFDGYMTDVTEDLGLGVGADINNEGHIATTTALGNAPQGALWNGKKIFPLGTLGGEYSFTTALNERGEVVGESERAPGGDRIFYSFFWSSGHMIDLESATGRRPVEDVLNDCGEVLLRGELDAGIPFYRYRADGTLLEVRGATPPYDNWSCLNPRKMNDYGEIVGYGSHNHLTRAFLLAPLEEDVNIDGLIDLRDFVAIQLNYTGPMPPAIPGCLRADIDRDADVDLNDVGEFQHLLGAGPSPAASDLGP